MILGILMIIAGFWLAYVALRYCSSMGYAKDLEIHNELLATRLRSLEIENAILHKQIILLNQRDELRLLEKSNPTPVKPDPKTDTSKEAIELISRTAFDAIHALERSKAALVSVLQNDGCTPEQIESVLQKIDNEVS